MEHSLPEAFCTRLRAQLGNEAEALLQSLDRPANTSVLLHPEKGMHLFPEATAVKWNALGRLLNDRPTFALDPFYHSGAYYPQESSSMFIHTLLAQCLPQKPGITALDVCASPGGKSIELSHYIGPQGRLISNEINKTRNAILRENLVRNGRPHFMVTAGGAEELHHAAAIADVVLVDAPCSGEGMFRKDPAARSHWSEENVQQCAIRQRDILEQLLPYMQEGALLIYSTCTFAPAENEGITQWLLESGEWEAMHIDLSAYPEVEAHAHGYRFLPHRVPGEGFFVSIWKKTQLPQALPKPQRSFRPHFREATKKEAALLPAAFAESTVVLDPENRVYLSPFDAEELNRLARTCFITQPGACVGELIHQTFSPLHDLAFTSFAVACTPTHEVNAADALRFLRKEDLSTLPAAKGIHLVTYQGLGLGYIKALGHRANNYLPKEWVLRLKA